MAKSLHGSLDVIFMTLLSSSVLKKYFFLIGINILTEMSEVSYLEVNSKIASQTQTSLVPESWYVWRNRGMVTPQGPF